MYNWTSLHLDFSLKHALAVCVMPILKTFTFSFQHFGAQTGQRELMVGLLCNIFKLLVGETPLMNRSWRWQIWSYTVWCTATRQKTTQHTQTDFIHKHSDVHNTSMCRSILKHRHHQYQNFMHKLILKSKYRYCDTSDISNNVCH